MAPTALAYYDTIRDRESVEVSDENRWDIEELEAEGWGHVRNLGGTQSFWPLRIHPASAVVRTGRRWYASLFAEVSLCDDPCRCGEIMADHCGERIATLMGARLRKRDLKQFDLVASSELQCMGEPLKSPITAQISLTETELTGVSGHFTRAHGTLEGVHWWTPGELEAIARPCMNPGCDPSGPHLRLPRNAPARPEFDEMIGRRIAFTMVSIALVDSHGRRHLERGVDGHLPTSWRGPELE